MGLGSFLADVTGLDTTYVGTALSGIDDAFGKSWDWLKDSPEAISGAVGIAKGIQGYYAAEDAEDAAREQREAYLYGPKSSEAQIARHNEGIADLADVYKKKQIRGVLRGGAN